MLKEVVYLFPISLCFFLLGCRNETDNQKVHATKVNLISTGRYNSTEPITIDILPFEDTPPEIISSLFETLRHFCPNVQVKSIIAFPENAFYEPRHRYKADSLINFLSSITPVNHVSIGITVKDISTTNGKIPDWGVMGLSFQPGNACIVSTFRLNKGNLLDQLFKVSIHELGHTQGLDHCEMKSCYMRDAEGKNTTDQEIAFCPRCKTFLISKGWVLK